MTLPTHDSNSPKDFRHAANRRRDRSCIVSIANFCCCFSSERNPHSSTALLGNDGNFERFLIRSISAPGSSWMVFCRGGDSESSLAQPRYSLRKQSETATRNAQTALAYSFQVSGRP